MSGRADGRRERGHPPDYFARLADGTGAVVDVVLGNWSTSYRSRRRQVIPETDSARSMPLIGGSTGWRSYTSPPG
ncbi:hypothetical protein [Streptomyces sp. ISL-11]|uniref:hypothetical protein n=1 Tax=Streptomyces sp. ISL-11 TaxID=2819174 RepID=UPI00203608A6|nr:hypothetical protein [Streptomyces sp. ISL-11]